MTRTEKIGPLEATAGEIAASPSATDKAFARCWPHRRSRSRCTRVHAMATSTFLLYQSARNKDARNKDRVYSNRTSAAPYHTVPPQLDLCRLCRLCSSVRRRLSTIDLPVPGCFRNFVVSEASERSAVLKCLFFVTVTTVLISSHVRDSLSGLASVSSPEGCAPNLSSLGPVLPLARDLEMKDARERD